MNARDGGSASAPVHQQTEGTRNWRGLGFGLFRGRCRCRAKVGGVDEQLVRLGIEGHVACAEFSFHSLDDAELVGTVFVEDVQDTFAYGREEQAGFRFIDVGVDAGADRAMTQFFFDNDHYFRYLDRVRARGIGIPIVPGILPVQNFKQAKTFAERCGASVPRWLAERFDGLEDDPATRKLIAAAVAAEQVLDLVDRGVSDFHFYTMNRADLVYAICHLLGLRPNAAPVAKKAVA